MSAVAAFIAFLIIAGLTTVLVLTFMGKLILPNQCKETCTTKCTTCTGFDDADKSKESLNMYY